MIKQFIYICGLLTIAIPAFCQETITFDNYTVENGLSHNYIDCIFQDNDGWIWLGTGMSIERFDGINFKQFGLLVNDSTIKKGMLIRDFYQHSDGRLFACSEEYGIGCYNKAKEIFEPLRLNGRKILYNQSTKHLCEDKSNNLWVSSKRGIYKINFTTNKFDSLTFNPKAEYSISDNYTRITAVDNQQRIWIGTLNGLDIYNPLTGIIINLGKTSDYLKDDILDIYISGNTAWIGTAHNGIIVINTETLNVTKFKLDPENERSRKVYSIIEDRNQQLWIGTRGGLYIYNKQNESTRHYVNDPLLNTSLVHTSTLGLLEDNKGDIWIGTRGGFSYMAKEKQAFKHFAARPNNKHYLNNSETWAICSIEDEIWFGTERGGINIYDRKKGTYTYMQPPVLSSDCIKSIVQYNERFVLIGTFEGGLNVYDRNKKKIKIYKPDPNNPKSIASDIVWDIHIDKKNHIWLATNNGLDLFDIEKGTFSHKFSPPAPLGVSFIVSDNENDLWMGLENLLIIRPGFGTLQEYDFKARNFFQDTKGRCWITTEDHGVILFDKYKGPVKSYSETKGLASRMSYCILEDNETNLWISTANGLSCFNPEKESFTNYSKEDGLQGNQFLYGSAHKSKNGELMFGGAHGVNAFFPSALKQYKNTAPLYLTKLKIFNEPIAISRKKESILTKSISETEVLEIPYKYNVLTFEFASLNYTNSFKNKYKYFLEGFDNKWVNAHTQRSATYTNLNPGSYTFKVIGSNNNGSWNQNEATLQLKILPPYYMTIWFRLLLGSILTVIIYLTVHYISKRRDLNRALVFEKEKAKKIHELDNFKLQFFTNISHEVKTPLTLIISPLERILKLDLSKEEIKDNLAIVYRNAQHLMKLINQLLDYRKLEAGKLKLELKKGDIVQFCYDVLITFKDGFEETQLSHKFKSVQKEIFTYFDPDKLKKTLDNLISNAIKYNKPGGSVSVFISLVIDEGNSEKSEEQFIKVVVKDTGNGIPAKNISNIFNRFYSGHNGNKASTGIGLAFTKDLIRLQKGKIYAESKVGKGSSFTVLLPLIDGNNDIEIISEKIIESQVTASDEELETEISSRKIMLITEDNKDVRQFLKNHFEKEYLIYEAENGKQGFEIASKAIPDVIISDIMMPVMNGTAFCEKIKKDERTSHIPVIQLSALSSKDQVMESLLKGADDYITKPFDITILQTKIDNLISMQKSLRDKYTKESILEPSMVTLNSPDELFLHKAVKIVEKNIDDPGLDIEKFVQQIGISRMQLYRKMSALTNMTVKEFINDIRLKRAYQLLKDKKLNVSEVAYAVGFNDTSYFGKCIRKKYGMSATEISKGKK